jgi:hypothetical protein
MLSSSSDAKNQGIELPSWLFDVDEDDEELTSASGTSTLLQELEIDLEHIYR